MNDGDLEEDQCQEVISIFRYEFYASLSIYIKNWMHGPPQQPQVCIAFVKSFFRAGSFFLLARSLTPPTNFAVRKSFRYCLYICYTSVTFKSSRGPPSSHFITMLKCSPPRVLARALTKKAFTPTVLPTFRSRGLATVIDPIQKVALLQSSFKPLYGADEQIGPRRT
jgi:hypothetical protein